MWLTCGGLDSPTFHVTQSMCSVSCRMQLEASTSQSSLQVGERRGVQRLCTAKEPMEEVQQGGVVVQEPSQLVDFGPARCNTGGVNLTTGAAALRTCAWPLHSGGSRTFRGKEPARGLTHRAVVSAGCGSAELHPRMLPSAARV